MTLGFVLMVFGMLGYIGSILFSLMTQDIYDLRLATLISFISVMSFMLGSILEVKGLTYGQDKPAKVKKVYLTDLRLKAISFMLIAITISMVILIMCLLTFEV